MARQKNYKVSFSDDERRNLRKILKRTNSTNRRSRCTILLNADEFKNGYLSYHQIAEQSGVSLKL